MGKLRLKATLDIVVGTGMRSTAAIAAIQTSTCQGSICALGDNSAGWRTSEITIQAMIGMETPSSYPISPTGCFGSGRPSACSSASASIGSSAPSSRETSADTGDLPLGLFDVATPRRHALHRAEVDVPHVLVRVDVGARR